MSLCVRIHADKASSQKALYATSSLYMHMCKYMCTHAFILKTHVAMHQPLHQLQNDLEFLQDISQQEEILISKNKMDVHKGLG